MVAGIEAAVEDAAGGGCGSAQDGRVDEGRRVGRPQLQPVGSRPPLGPRSCPEALGSCRAGLLTPADEIVERDTDGRAVEGLGAAMVAYSFRPIWRTSTYFYMAGDKVIFAQMATATYQHFPLLCVLLKPLGHPPFGTD